MLTYQSNAKLSVFTLNRIRKTSPEKSSWSNRIMEAERTIDSREAQLGTDSTGRRTINQYTVVKKLGEGSYGKVKLVETGGKLFAMKVLHKDVLRRQREFVVDAKGARGVKNALNDALNEISIMQRLQHPNVVQLHEVLHDTREKLYLSTDYIVIDYCGKGPVLQWQQREQRFTHTIDGLAADWIDEDYLRDIFRQLVAGVQYCENYAVHRNRVIHRDIKPQNIFVTENDTVKLGDFGQAITFGADDLMGKTAGTLHFFPPEACGETKKKFSGQAADIWALGMTMYALIYLRLPYRGGESFADVVQGITTFTLDFPSRPETSPELRRLLSKLLEKDPHQRCSAADLSTDPWLAGEEESGLPEKSDSVVSVGGISFSV